MKIIKFRINELTYLYVFSLFETHPDVQQSFMPFKGVDIEDLKHSRQLRDHALRYYLHTHVNYYTSRILYKKVHF